MASNDPGANTDTDHDPTPDVDAMESAIAQWIVAVDTLPAGLPRRELKRLDIHDYHDRRRAAEIVRYDVDDTHYRDLAQALHAVRVAVATRWD